MPRTTRSSSRGRTTVREELKDEGQSQVTDYFKTTRRGRKPTEKDAQQKLDQADVTTIPTQITKSLPSPPKVKREEKGGEQITASPSRQAARKLFDDSPKTKETSANVRTVENEVTISPRKAAKKLFGDSPKVDHEKLNEDKRHDNIETIETLVLQKSPLRAKKAIKSVAQLQSLLAQKESIQRLHIQAIENKVERVLHNAEVLKSPQKSVTIAAKAPPKQQKKKPTGVSPIKVVHVPDYVLPGPQNGRKEQKREETPEEEIVAGDYKKKTALLKSEVRDSAACPLPKSYKLLHEKFQSGDRILSIMMQQGKRITFDELTENVRKAMKRDFTKKDFACFVQLYKEAYLMNLEKGWMAFGGARKGWDLVIRPNLKDDLKEWMLDEGSLEDSTDSLPLMTPSMLCSPTKGQPGGVPRSPRKAPCQPMPRAPLMDGRERLEGWRMLCRAHIFRFLLTKLVHEAHAAFLGTLGVDLKKKPVRLHPQFQLETCPDVPEGKLPEPPKNEGAPKTMSDYMSEVGVAANLEGVKRVLADLTSPQKTTRDGVPLSPKKFANKQAVDEAKSGGANSLLARIRAKEAAKKAAMASIDPVKEKRISRIDRLLIGALRTVTSFFALKKTYSLNLTAVVDKMMQTIRFLAHDEAISCLQLLCEISPKNVEMAEVAGQKYLKIIKNDYDSISADLMKEKNC
ncbi:unnamed protein product, partial [Mesorhabditis belari]|uniref:CDT1 Geminin-binding domain-containing protein n=1 Tax=Mesorhabditis belari TaxID=2138241 RepID=A0AAF3F1L9_9BILA